MRTSMPHSLTVLTVRSALAAAALAGCASSAPAPSPAAAPAVAAAPPSTGPSLYQQLGGYDQLAKLRDDFLGRMVKDSTLGPFFAGLTQPQLDRIRQMVVDQLCAVTGGPCVYVGKSMKEAHKDLDITAADWQQAMRLFNLALDDFHVTREQRNALLAVMRSVEPEIVRAPVKPAN